MKRNCLVLLFLFMLLLTASAYAVPSGDITFKFNPAPAGDGRVWYGTTNIVEIWVTNSDDILGLSLGFEFTSTIPGFTWKDPYGNRPNLGGHNWIQEWGDALGVFDQGYLKFTSSSLPSMFLIGGAATPAGDPNYGNPLPAHATSTKCWDLRLIMPSGSDGSFTVKPVFFPPAGSWKMDFGPTPLPGAIMPTFDGLSTGIDPAAPVLVDQVGPPLVVNGAIVVELGAMPCGKPVFTSVPGAAVSSGHGGYTYDFNATNGEIGTVSFSVTSTPAGATINPTTGVLTVPGQCPPLTTAVTVIASNGCPLPGNHTDYPFTITWTNVAPVIACPELGSQATTVGSPYTHTFTATDDPGDTQIWTVVSTNTGPIPPIPAPSTYGFVGNVFTFTPTDAGTFTFDVTATDGCGLTGVCHFDVEAKKYNIVQIAKMGEQYGDRFRADGSLKHPGEIGQNPGFVYQGTYQWVPVTLSSDELSLGGYNLLIHYDASALSFVSAEIGDPLKACYDPLKPSLPGGSGWEYFTYRFGADGNCSGSCPSGLLRLVAMAETNNGANHPGCHGLKNPYNLKGEIAHLKFYVTSNVTYECQYIEIGFVWLDCSDNSFSDTTGNLLYIAKNPQAVHTFEWNKLDLDSNYIACGLYPNKIGELYGGFCADECANSRPNKPNPLEFLYFMNGGIDIACADSIDARGDINLNGIANEIADAVLFTNFFLKGINAFDSDTQRRQGMIAATDVNADGHVLTVGDLVYLLRIIVGDAQPIAKLSPFASAATVNFANGSVSTESGSEIGAIYATFAINGAYNVVSNTNMTVASDEVNGELKVLVYSGMSNLSNRIASGTNELFTVSGNVELKGVEVADYYGNMLNTRINKTSLPTSFALSQNVPNPFNPTTKLGFALPNQTEWTLNIYNVAGQLVKSFSGNNIGNVSVEWDASMAPSGVYFYKLNAGSYSDTKKMVLMK